jgi:3-oxoacyl-[acyl-carrier-protein] synthase-3
MNGANVFNFTIRVVPPLIAEVLALAEVDASAVDHFVFHQSNRFIINHLVSKCRLPADKVPMTIEQFGNTGGPSIPLTVTQTVPREGRQHPLSLLLLGYGVGLSWAGGLVTLMPDAVLCHADHPIPAAVSA